MPTNTVTVNPNVQGTAPPPASYREATDALAGALERLAEKLAVVNQAQAALTKANEEYEAAKDTASQVRAKLDAHLLQVLPPANRRP